MSGLSDWAYTLESWESVRLRQLYGLAKIYPRFQVDQWASPAIKFPPAGLLQYRTFMFTPQTDLTCGLYLLNAGEADRGNWVETEKGFGVDLEVFYGGLCLMHVERLYQTYEKAAQYFASTWEQVRRFTVQDFLSNRRKFKGELQ